MEGDLDATDPELACATELGVLCHDLVGLDIEDVTLLEIIKGGVQEVGITEVELVDLILTIRQLPQQLNIVTLAIDGHITSHSQRLKDSAFVAGDGEGVGTLDLTHDGDLVVLDKGV